MLGSIEGNSKREKQQIKRTDGIKYIMEKFFPWKSYKSLQDKIETTSTCLPSHPRLESGGMAPKIFLKNGGIEKQLKNRLTE